MDINSSFFSKSFFTIGFVGLAALGVAGFELLGVALWLDWTVEVVAEPTLRAFLMAFTFFKDCSYVPGSGR